MQITHEQAEEMIAILTTLPKERWVDHPSYSGEYDPINGNWCYGLYLARKMKDRSDLRHVPCQGWLENIFIMNDSSETPEDALGKISAYLRGIAA